MVSLFPRFFFSVVLGSLNLQCSLLRPDWLQALPIGLDVSGTECFLNRLKSLIGSLLLL